MTSNSLRSVFLVAGVCALFFVVLSISVSANDVENGISIQIRIPVAEDKVELISESWGDEGFELLIRDLLGEKWSEIDKIVQTSFPVKMMFYCHELECNRSVSFMFYQGSLGSELHESKVTLDIPERLSEMLADDFNRELIRKREGEIWRESEELIEDLQRRAEEQRRRLEQMLNEGSESRE